MATLDVVGVYADDTPPGQRTLDILGVTTNVGPAPVALVDPPEQGSRQYPEVPFFLLASTQDPGGVAWSETGPLDIADQDSTSATVVPVPTVPTSEEADDLAPASVTAAAPGGGSATLQVQVVPQITWSWSGTAGPAFVTPGAPGTPVDGSLVHYPSGNTGNVAQWDATGAIVSTSGWIDIWGGSSPSAISAEFSGLVSSNEIAELTGSPTLILVPVMAGASWTLQVRRNGSVVATTAWDNTGQRIAIGSDGSSFHVQTGSLDYQTPVATLGDVFFCFPSGTPRMRDILVGTWPLPGGGSGGNWVGGGPEPA